MYVHTHKKINKTKISLVWSNLCPLASEQIAGDCQELANDHHLETGTSHRETHQTKWQLSYFMLCTHPSPSSVTTTAISPRLLRALATFLEAPETRTYIAKCYGLNVCYSTPQFHMWKSYPHCASIRRWNLWEEIRSLWVAFVLL